MNRYLAVLSVVAVLLVGLVLFSRSAAAQNDPRVESTVVEQVIAPSEQRAALRYWTRERLAGAEPLSMQVTADTLDPLTDERDDSVGVAEMLPAGLPAPDAEAVARAAYPQDWEAIDAALPLDEAARGPDGTSAVYTAYMANYNSALWKIYPHVWTGQFSFRDAGTPKVCSATVLRGNTIVTAAHCLYDTTNNRWMTHRAFTPAYRNGSAPYGTFATTSCWVMTSWINLSGSYALSWARHDVGVCRLGNNSAGQSINTAVGYAGRSQNNSYTGHYHSLGYPVYTYNNTLFSNAGKYLRLCAAESAQYATDVLRIGCNMGGGASGGPWLLNYAPTVASAYVAGVNSGISVGQQNMYGARFSSGNIVPLCSSAGC